MKFRKLILTVAVAALAAPGAVVSMASASPTPDVPPVCSRVPTACLMVARTHTSTFSGTYNARTGSFNDTDAGGTCVDGSSAAGERTCRFTFTGGNPKTLCTPNPTTRWSPKWDWYPDRADQSIDIGGDSLFAEGGGVIDDTGVLVGEDGIAVAFHVHVQIVSICGNEDTVQSLLDNITATSGLGNVDLSKTYKFTGYVDIV
jgi:hypothetical protein